MKQFIALVPCFLWLVACTTLHAPTAADAVAVGATANPHLIATAQADQYWRDAEATSQAYQLTVAANYRQIEATAQAATSTIQAQHTRDTLSLSLTSDAATVQAAETKAAATAQAASSATAQAQQNSIATGTAVAAATAAAFQATRQALALQQAQAEAQRQQIITLATTILLSLLALCLLVLLVWFLWRLIPTLISRLGLVRYGQHGNPLLLTVKNGQTILIDPLRMLQAALTIDGSGSPIMPELTPNQLQTLVTGGVLRTLLEQTRHAPGHAPQLPAETIRERRLGPLQQQTTVRHQPALPRPAWEAEAEAALPMTSSPSLPAMISWPALVAHNPTGLALGMGQQEVIALDISRTPHILLSGSSGAGKTRRALRPLVAQALGQGMLVLLLNESGADFSPFYDLPNAVLVRGDPTSYIATLNAALEEMQRREEMLRVARVSEWQRLPHYQQHGAPLLLVIDEVLSLAMLMPPREQKEFWGLLAAYASRARKLAMGSIGALTDPTYRVLGAGLNWREQCNARISFRVAKAAVSRAVLDSNGAEALATGHFLAMLGAAELVQGVAANPSDEELQGYLAKTAVTPIARPWWVESLAEPTQPQPPQLVATSFPAAQPAPAAPQPVAEPTLPLDAAHPPTAAERAYIRQLYASGLSKNGVCRRVYGFKDGRTYGWITAALNEAADEEANDD